MHARTHAHTHECTNTRTYKHARTYTKKTHTRAPVHTHMYACTRTPAHARIHTYRCVHSHKTRARTHTHIHMNTRIRAHTHAYMYTRTPIHVLMRAYPRTNTHTHIHAHTLMSAQGWLYSITSVFQVWGYPRHQSMVYDDVLTRCNARLEALRFVLKRQHSPKHPYYLSRLRSPHITFPFQLLMFITDPTQVQILYYC